MSRIEIVTKETISREDIKIFLLQLAPLLVNHIDPKYGPVVVNTDVSQVRDCSKEVCNIEE